MTTNEGKKKNQHRNARKKKPPFQNFHLLCKIFRHCQADRPKKNIGNVGWLVYLVTFKIKFCCFDGILRKTKSAFAFLAAQMTHWCNPSTIPGFNGCNKGLQVRYVVLHKQL